MRVRCRLNIRRQLTAASGLRSGERAVRFRGAGAGTGISDKRCAADQAFDLFPIAIRTSDGILLVAKNQPFETDVAFFTLIFINRHSGVSSSENRA